MATIRKRGAKWQVQVRRAGCRAVTRSFHVLRDAQARARQMELQADRSELPCDPKALQRVTLGQLVERYRDTVSVRTIGKIQVFDKAGDYATVSEVTVIRQKSLNPYYLAAFLRSQAGQRQIERLITGATGQLHLYPRDVERIWIPTVPEDAQNRSELLSNEAADCRRRARDLFDRARNAVEMAVQQGDAAALDFLNQAASGASGISV